MTRIYGERRSLLLKRLAERCGDRLEPIPAAAGLHVAARLKPGTDGARVVAAAAQAGVGVRALSEFAAALLEEDGLVFGYGGADLPLIEEATRRLGEVLARC
jgi:GntR family transcriptional regulator/MocR family aminotransferase